MKHRLQSLGALFERDLNRLKTELEQLSSEHIWKKKEGITNTCGVLTQHIVGNLNHYIGTALGNTGYERDRDQEFRNTGISREKLIKRIEATAGMITEVLKNLDEELLDNEYPLDIPMEYTTYQFLLHLYGHLSYHLGQVNYLRRILAEN